MIVFQKFLQVPIDIVSSGNAKTPREPSQHQGVKLPRVRGERIQSSHIDVGVSQNGGTQQPLVYLLKMIILGCFGVPPFKETPMY